MGNVKKFAYNSRHLKYHGYCKYHNTIFVTVHT